MDSSEVINLKSQLTFAFSSCNSFAQRFHQVARHPFFLSHWCDLPPVRHCAMCNAASQAETQCNLAQAVEAFKGMIRMTSLRQLYMNQIIQQMLPKAFAPVCIIVIKHPSLPDRWGYDSSQCQVSAEDVQGIAGQGPDKRPGAQAQTLQGHRF